MENDNNKVTKKINLENSTVEFFINEKSVFLFEAEKVGHNINNALILHGASQKFGDSYSGFLKAAKKNPKLDFSFFVLEALESTKKNLASWAVKEPVERKSAGKMLKISAIKLSLMQMPVEQRAATYAVLVELQGVSFLTSSELEAEPIPPATATE